jgi:2-polyprenyl-3-methyl-5-hydroxy-6-metoxy-1,4-benzoquinol methylase
MAGESLHCKICGAAALEEMSEFTSLPRVTSDCVPFREGGKLAICGACGGAQAIADEHWFADIDEIYSNYHIYHQSGGVEQHVLDPRSGELRRRSAVLVNRLAEIPGVPRSGKVLDVGCGTGGTLRAFGEDGDWTLYGLEMDERNASFLRRIPKFEKLYTCAPEDVPEQFDMVTMVHVLEHFPEPMDTLHVLRDKVAPGGRVFVQVPNAAANPFEYLVADHMIHFTAETLELLAERAGLRVERVATDWVTKELSLVARPRCDEEPQADRRPGGDAVKQIRSQAQWLYRLMDDAKATAGANPVFGLFGASIAATWLCGLLGDRVAFFVEEDSNRIGRTHMGRPILSPEQVPAGSVVFVALIPAIAAKICDRLRPLGVDLRLPPEMT